MNELRFDHATDFYKTEDFGPASYDKQTGDGENIGDFSLPAGEKEEPLTEEDLLLYQIRKVCSGMTPDREMENMEDIIPFPIPAWTEEDAAGLTAGRLYMQLGMHLQSGQITDDVRQETEMLSDQDREGDPGFKEFYAAFMVLQSSPSRQQMENICGKIRNISCPAPFAEGMRILENAIRETGRRQDAVNAEKDRENREKQEYYNEVQEQAQKRYDTAHQRAEHWRK